MSDMEEFLRRAAERRARAKPRPAIQIVEPIEAEVVEAEAVDIATQVASHFDTSGFDTRASQLGGRVGLADDRLEARLQATFDHQLGGLPSRSPVQAEVLPAEALPPQAPHVPTTAAGLRELLRSPHHLRQAVLLSEILRPPGDRW